MASARPRLAEPASRTKSSAIRQAYRSGSTFRQHGSEATAAGLPGSGDEPLVPGRAPVEPEAPVQLQAREAQLQPAPVAIQLLLRLRIGCLRPAADGREQNLLALDQLGIAGRPMDR